jgi:hypothetical protein
MHAVLGDNVLEQVPKPLVQVGLMQPLPVIRLVWLVQQGLRHLLACFTAPTSQRDNIQKIGKSLNLPLTLIGQTLPKKDSESKIYLLDVSGTELSDVAAAPFLKSFDHFSS